MQTLSVLAVEDGAVVVASPSGERFRLPVDAALAGRIVAATGSREERRLSPREIQAHVRSGLSAEQVAALTGVPVASIERFVGPVLAERAYIVESGLAVRLPPETEGARSRTFGAVMGERLDALSAKDVRWSSAKEPSGWVLSVRFAADELQHDARWRFDPKHMRLEPDNVEASTLSQQGVPAALTPRLRAIEPTAPVAVVAVKEPPAAPLPPAAAAVRRAAEPPDPARSRFDSDAFDFPPPAVRETVPDEEQTPGDAAEADDLPATTAIDVVAQRRAEARGQDPVPDEVFAPRPAAPQPVAERDTAPVTPLRPRHVEPARVEDRPTEPFRRRRERTPVQQTVPLPPVDPAEEPRAVPSPRPRRGRTSMPSWDEIVFGRDETP